MPGRGHRRGVRLRAGVAGAEGQEVDLRARDVLRGVELADGHRARRLQACAEGAQSRELDGVGVAQFAGHHFAELLDHGLHVRFLHGAVALHLLSQLVGAINVGVNGLGKPLAVGLRVLLVVVLVKSVKYCHRKDEKLKN